MSLPLLKPLLLTVGATSLIFFGGVIALAVQSPESASTSSAANLITQDTSIPSASSDLSSFKTVANSLAPSSLTKQSSLAALTPAQAAALAKQDMPSAMLQATPELINYNGTVAYEVLLDSGTTYIDANLGVVLNPAATDNYRVDGYDDDYDDDDYDDDDDDDDYKKDSRLIATNYEQYDEDDHDEDSYDD